MSEVRRGAGTLSEEPGESSGADHLGHAGDGEEVLDPTIEGSALWKWLNPRFGIEKMGLRRFVLEAMNAPHPRWMNPLDYMGDILLFLFANQVITGLLLMTHYNGSAMADGTAANPYPAYASTLAMTHVWWEAFVRDLHFWGANAMIVAAAVHMARVFYLGAYKPPREFQWLSGLILLACTIGLALSGYLLPWDQQAYWATEVATAMVKYVPWIGTDLLYFLRGCRFTCGQTLTVFFTIHVVLLPLLLLLTVGLHVLLVIIHGQVDVEARLPESYRKSHRVGELKDYPRGWVPFWPNIVANILLYSALTALILVLIAANRAAPLEAQANYINVEPVVQKYYQPLPVWYFLQFYQVLKVAKNGLEDRLLVLGLPIVVGAILVLLPFIDRNPSHRAKDRPLALALGALFVIGVSYYEYEGWKSENPPNVEIKQVIANPSFKKEILPLLQAKCTPCHIQEQLGGLNLNSYAGITAGGQLGQVIDKANPEQSHIILLLQGQDPALQGLQMPLGQTPLTNAEIQTIANWIKEGAPNN
jgi:quinol-cytochrome oxidoreductase complex cytochrome b subunit